VALGIVQRRIISSQHFHSGVLDKPWSFGMVERVRNYKHEYAIFHGKPEERKKRSMRVLARRAYEKEHGDQTGLDIDHKTPLRNGGGNGKGNLRAISIKKNRGWNRGL
jgi:hypothetical protein